MRVLGVIPARWGARRFPGKPLAKVAGIPLVQRVFEGAARARRLDRLVVATDDARIAEACTGFGAEAIFTAPAHPSGTDRVAEVAAKLPGELVVNVQGDEPLIEGRVIDALVDSLEADASAPMATIVHPAEPEALDDPNRVKVVLDRGGRALYFSRSRIPYARPGAPAPRYWQHAGLYAYRRAFLLEYVRLEPTPAEVAEGLEQLRALEHGHAIHAAIVEDWRSLPVDVPEDVPRVEASLRGDAARIPGA